MGLQNENVWHSGTDAQPFKFRRSPFGSVSAIGNVKRHCVGFWVSQAQPFEKICLRYVFRLTKFFSFQFSACSSFGGLLEVRQQALTRIRYQNPIVNNYFLRKPLFFRGLSMPAKHKPHAGPCFFFLRFSACGFLEIPF